MIKDRKPLVYFEELLRRSPPPGDSPPNLRMSYNALQCLVVLQCEQRLVDILVNVQTQNKFQSVMKFV